MILSGFHFYWLFGGKWGGDQVFPTKNNNSPPITIPKLPTLIVAFGLWFIGLIYLNKSGLVSISFPDWLIRYGAWFIPCIFILRAIGEFKYVGFFKKIKGTKFAKADTKLFSPLCLFIGLAGILIQLLSE